METGLPAPSRRIALPMAGAVVAGSEARPCLYHKTRELPRTCSHLLCCPRVLPMVVALRFVGHRSFRAQASTGIGATRAALRIGHNAWSLLGFGSFAVVIAHSQAPPSCLSTITRAVNAALRLPTDPRRASECLPQPLVHPDTPNR